MSTEVLGLKRCGCCHQWKETSEFNKTSRTSGDGLNYYCKKRHYENTKESQKQRNEYQKERWRTYMRERMARLRRIKGVPRRCDGFHPEYVKVQNGCLLHDNCSTCYYKDCIFESAEYHRLIKEGVLGCRGRV